MKLEIIAGRLTPVWLPHLPDTIATSILVGAELMLPIQTTPGTGFDHEGLSDGELALAIEEEGPLAFFLIRLRSLRQDSYLMTPFEAPNTPSPISLREVKNISSGKNSISVRVWTQNDAGIVQTVRQTRMPAGLQTILIPIIRRQLSAGDVDWEEGKKVMRRFMDRTGDPALAFENCRIKQRIF